MTIFVGLVHMDSLGSCKPAGRMHGSNAVVDNLSFCLAERPERARRFSMENMEIMKLTPDKKVRSVLIVFHSHNHCLSDNSQGTLNCSFHFTFAESRH